MENNNSTKLVDAAKMMAAFNISRNSLQKWMKLGCPCYRATHEKTSKIWFDISEVEAWIRRDPIDAVKE